MMEPSWLLWVMILPFQLEGYQPYGYGFHYNNYDPSVVPDDFSSLPGPIESFREELVIDQVVEESRLFKINAKNIKQWLRLKLDYLYLLGIGNKEVTLATVYKLKSNKYQVNEYPVVLPYNVSCGVMFKPRRLNGDNFEGIVLLGLQSPQPMISMYKIKNFKLQHFTDLKRDNQIQALSHFKWLHDDRFIIFEEWKNISRAVVYGLEIDNNAPHFWHIETLPIDGITGQPSIGRAGEETLYLAVIQEKYDAVNVYSYKRVCTGLSGNKFYKILTIPDLRAKKTIFFQAFGQLYFLVNGLQSVLYRITAEGFLMKDLIFSQSVEMMVIPLTTSRGDAVILGKSSDGFPHFYTLANGDKWEEKLGIKCKRSTVHGYELVELKDCIGGSRSWVGATYLEAEGYPSILFADRIYPGELYHMAFSFVKMANMEQSVNRLLLNQLESYWNSLRDPLNRLIHGRSREVSSQSITSLCSIQKEIDKMYHLLSDIKLHLNSTDCSALEHNFSPRNGHYIVSDEAKPIETISNLNLSQLSPGIKTEGYREKSNESTINRSKESAFKQYSVSASTERENIAMNHKDTLEEDDMKFQPISPELNNIGDKMNDHMFEDSYGMYDP